MTTKKKNYIHIKLIIIMAIVTIIAFIWNRSIYNESSYAVSQEITKPNTIKSYKKIEQNVDLESIIEKNRNKQEEKIEVTPMDLEYTTTYQSSNELPKDTLQVLQEGKIGKQEQIIRKVFENGELVKEETVGTKVVVSSINKIVLVGTGDFSNNHKVKVGEMLYVTSDTLDMKREKDENSARVFVLNRNDSVQLLKVDGNWYEVLFKNYSGWVNKDCLTYINPNIPNEEKNNKSTYTKAQLLAKLSKNMKLNTPSGLSLVQFKKILSGNEKDKNKIFERNAQYFYYIEKQYNINGVFVAAVAIHESNWGTSKLATTKNNLFGYGAYDSDPYNSAYSFSSHSEGIDLLGRVFMKYYLNPAGNKIYGSEIATGSYYNGPTIEGVNKKYATDKNWKNGVYKWMEYLYNRI